MFQKVLCILLVTSMLRYIPVSSLPIEPVTNLVGNSVYRRTPRTIWPFTVLSSLHSASDSDWDFLFGEKIMPSLEVVHENTPDSTDEQYKTDVQQDRVKSDRSNRDEIQWTDSLYPIIESMDVVKAIQNFALAIVESAVYEVDHQDKMLTQPTIDLNAKPDLEFLDDLGGLAYFLPDSNDSDKL